MLPSAILLEQLRQLGGKPAAGQYIGTAGVSRGLQAFGLHMRSECHDRALMGGWELLEERRDIHRLVGQINEHAPAALILAQPRRSLNVTHDLQADSQRNRGPRHLAREEQVAADEDCGGLFVFSHVLRVSFLEFAGIRPTRKVRTTLRLIGGTPKRPSVPRA